MLNLGLPPDRRRHEPAMLFAPADGRLVRSAVRPARLLLVEDEYLVATELEFRLEQAGFQVVGIAATADEALALADSTRPDLAIIDIRLGEGRDGVEVATELASSLDLRSVFATAHGDAATRLRARAARPLAWVQKPYSSEELIQVLNAVLAG